MIGIGTLHSRDTGRQIGLKLEEVQVPPSLLAGVMNRGSSPANRTGKGGSAMETDFDVKPLIFLGKLNPLPLMGERCQGPRRTMIQNSSD